MSAKDEANARNKALSEARTVFHKHWKRRRNRSQRPLVREDDNRWLLEITGRQFGDDIGGHSFKQLDTAPTTGPR